MIQKAIAAVLIAALCLTCAGALADTYADRDGDFSFDYDPAAFEIVMEDYADDGPRADMVLILEGKDDAWGVVDVDFLRMKGAYTPEDLSELAAEIGVQPEQGEWNGFSDVTMYACEDAEEGLSEQTYILRYGGEMSLTVSVLVSQLDDEEAVGLRDDAISALLDTLKLTAQ